jgi:hypothetical protein
MRFEDRPFLASWQRASQGKQLLDAALPGPYVPGSPAQPARGCFGAIAAIFAGGLRDQEFASAAGTAGRDGSAVSSECARELAKPLGLALGWLAL